MMQRILILLLAAALSSTAGWAQKAPLTLEDAVRLALQRNPSILVSQDELDELKGKITEVRSSAYPQVAFQGYGMRSRDPMILNSSSFDKVPEEFRNALVPSPSNLFEIGVNLKQPIYTAGKVRTAIRLAEESLSEKEASREEVRQQVIFRVFQAFHDILLAKANKEVVLENQQQRVKHLEQARARFDSGVATQIDVLRSEVDVANLEPVLIRAENRIGLARAALNNLIVEDLESPTEIAGTLDYKPWPMGSLDEIQKRAIDQRAEIQAARRIVNEARLMLSLANAEKKLSVDLDAFYGYNVREPQNFFDSDYSRWNFTFNFKLPFIDSGRKRGQVAQAAARLRASQQRLTLLEMSVRLDVKQAYDDMQSAAKAIAAAKLSVSQAEKVLEMMQANYQYGAATTLDVTDSQTALTVARSLQISATYDYEIAKARLRLASGNPILDREVN